jgi:hypothetical protein
MLMTLTEFEKEYHVLKGNLYKAIEFGNIREHKIVKTREILAVDEEEAKAYFKHLIK